MKKIGRGWQYVVYDLGNGRVRKQKYLKIAQYALIYLDTCSSKNHFPVIEAYKEMQRVNSDERASVEYVKKIDTILDKNILGNPVFVSSKVYEQDKVVPLRDALREVSFARGKEILDKYRELIYRTWEYGFSDRIFNFTINNGLTSTGEIIQLDFGELAFDKDEVRKRIFERRWLKSWSYLTFPEGELKRYYEILMDAEKMSQELDKRWEIKMI